MAQTTNHVVYWSQYNGGIGELYLGATINGLCFMGSPNKGKKEMEGWARKRFKNYDLIQDDDRLKPHKDELDKYFNGERKTFSMPIDLEGTVFQQKVWETLKEIPYGETYTYSQVAEMIQKPAAVRAVGAAISCNPILVSIPCHRVVGKDGSLTGYRGGLEMKKHLLQLENGGVVNG